MSFSKSTLLAVAGLLASANAHITISQPVPFSVATLDNAPLTGYDQFPCKRNLGFSVSKLNTMAAGSKQQITFKGSAIHGGGSCQLSVTTDEKPSQDSVFKVIKTFEGGCPVEGSLDYEIPTSVPNGKATFAWTWFAKLSGGPEMYMNCAPIEVTGGASDKTAFNQLPDMLVANLPNYPKGKCTSPVSKVLKIPNPGKNLVISGPESDIVAGSGDCGSSNGTTPAQPSGGSPSAPQSSAASQPSPPAGQPSAPAGQPSAPAGQPSAPAGQPSAPAGKPTAPAGKPTAPAGKPSAAPSAAPSDAPGGVFAPGASSVADAPAMTSTTLVQVTAVPTPAQPAPVSPGTGAPAVPAPAQPSSPSAGGGSAGTCSQNGAIVCNGTKQFGICNNGNVVWQDIASGTACTNGVISKRAYYGRITRPRNTY